jgi:hypothetical protein
METRRFILLGWHHAVVELERKSWAGQLKDSAKRNIVKQFLEKIE